MTSRGCDIVASGRPYLLIALAVSLSVSNSIIMENVDHIVDEPDEVCDRVVGERLKTLRIEAGMTLEHLAGLSGVSRAMISRIERGEASPTAVLLARLSMALGLSLSAFFASGKRTDPFLRREDQHVWMDPDTGYVRRSVSPNGTGALVDLVEVMLPSGRKVHFPPQSINAGVCQHVWVLEGDLLLEVEGQSYPMARGDCLYHDIGRGHSFINPGSTPVRYAVVLEHRLRASKG